MSYAAPSSVHHLKLVGVPISDVECEDVSGSGCLEDVLPHSYRLAVAWATYSDLFNECTGWP